MTQVKPNWKNLRGVDDWLPELKLLLNDARAAAQQPALAARLTVSEFLNGFIQESGPQTPEMDELDDLAQQTVTDLMIGVIEDRMGAIAARTAEYLKLEKEFNAAADRGESAADAIRLTGIRNLIDAATQTITSAKALVTSLDDSNADDKKISSLIDKTVAAVEKLRTEVAGLI